LRGKRSDTANKELSLVVTKRKAHAVSFKKSMCKKKKSSKDIGSANNTADDDDEELVVNSTVDDDGEELVVNNTAHDDVEELVVKSDNGVELNKEVSQIEGKGVNTRLLDSPRRSPRKLAEKRNNASAKIESSECESTSDASDGDNDQDFVSHDNDELDDDKELVLHCGNDNVKKVNPTSAIVVDVALGHSIMVASKRSFITELKECKLLQKELNSSGDVELASIVRRKKTEIEKKLINFEQKLGNSRSIAWEYCQMVHIDDDWMDLTGEKGTFFLRNYGRAINI
jgi:hypothetical protein